MTETYVATLQLAIASKDWGLCDTILAHIRSHLMHPSLPLLCLYASSLTRHHRISKAISLIEGIHKSQKDDGLANLSPSEMIELCEAVLKECSNCAFADDALWFSERMRGMELRPTITCWSYIIEALSKSNRLEEAHDAIHVQYF